MTESWSLPGKLSVDPQNLERLRELTRKIGERLQRETDAISHGMTAEIAAASVSSTTGRCVTLSTPALRTMSRS